MDQEKKRLKSLVRQVPNFPQEGIIFQDITTMLLDPTALSQITKFLMAHLSGVFFHKIVALEARGFIFGGALSAALQKPLVVIRKKSKLPSKTISVEYKKEYGPPDIFEIHVGAIEPNEHCLIIDDLLATGGTTLASVELCRRSGGIVAEVCFILAVKENQKATEAKLKAQGINTFVLLD